MLISVAPGDGTLEAHLNLRIPWVEQLSLRNRRRAYFDDSQKPQSPLLLYTIARLLLRQFRELRTRGLRSLPYENLCRWRRYRKVRQTILSAPSNDTKICAAGEHFERY